MKLNQSESFNKSFKLTITLLFFLFLSLLTFFLITNDSNKKNANEKYIHDVVNIITTFDSQISQNKKNDIKKTVLNHTETLTFINDLMKDKVNCDSDNANCLFWDSSPWKSEISSKFIFDNKKKINSFYLIFDFNEHFKSSSITSKRFLVIRAQKRDSFVLSSISKKNITGTHLYYFANINDISKKIDYSECKNYKCVFVASYQITN